MSTPEPTYTVTLTAAERGVLLASLHASVEIRGGRATSTEEGAKAALDAAKIVKPKRTAEPVRPLVSQGDPALDEFIAKHHDPKWRDRLKKATRANVRGMMPMPTPAPGIARKPMSQQERADLYRIHVIRSERV